MLNKCDFNLRLKIHLEILMSFGTLSDVTTISNTNQPIEDTEKSLSQFLSSMEDNVLGSSETGLKH